MDAERNPFLRLVRRVIPVTSDYRGQSFFVRDRTRWQATPHLLGSTSNDSGWAARDWHRTGAETWDPETSAFSPAGFLAEARTEHSATLLPDGRVLIASGPGDKGVLETAEVWAPSDE